MGDVFLTGLLVCSTREEAELVERLLPDHVALTRAEPGCASFEVTRRPDSLMWEVQERFNSEESFRAHQSRGALSAWGRETAGIERRYTVTGLTS
ncbi:putative quinol monooxygenase [Microbacterium telephonicum]|uniref:Quinol monooxygenase YgiN n=1 Tax=Microbacterium telephonicum TaxID=1714841 RepID=A0A498C3J0_9MICO|nr:antibiotic biosynthesis monooxygenase [Microbacterium telephonicum]RLK47438.1 quinol monooxygenase YgiN [Microbacterium telephonicum]